jgi:hypothetical protein
MSSQLFYKADGTLCKINNVSRVVEKFADDDEEDDEEDEGDEDDEGDEEEDEADEEDDEEEEEQGGNEGIRGDNLSLLGDLKIDGNLVVTGDIDNNGGGKSNSRIGEIFLWYDKNNIPDNAVVCDGQSVNRGKVKQQNRSGSKIISCDDSITGKIPKIAPPKKGNSVYCMFVN